MDKSYVQSVNAGRSSGGAAAQEKGSKAATVAAV